MFTSIASFRRIFHSMKKMWAVFRSILEAFWSIVRNPVWRSDWVSGEVWHGLAGESLEVYRDEQKNRCMPDGLAWKPETVMNNVSILEEFITPLMFPVILCLSIKWQGSSYIKASSTFPSPFSQHSVVIKKQSSRVLYAYKGVGLCRYNGFCSQ